MLGSLERDATDVRQTRTGVGFNATKELGQTLGGGALA